MPRDSSTPQPSDLTLDLTLNHRRVLAIAVPMVLSSLTVPIAGMVDTAVMGHLDDVHYLGAVAVASSLFAFIFMIFNFLRMGITGRAAQFFGAGDEAALFRLLVQGLVMAFVIGVLLILLQWPLAELGLAAMGASNAVAPEARNYFAIRIFGAPFLLGIYVLMGWFVGRQQSRRVLALLLLSNGLNILFDLGFVLGLGMDVEGVALATVLAEALAFSSGMFLLVRKERLVPMLRAMTRLFAPGEALALFHLNRDLFLRTVALMLVFTFFTAQGARQEDTILAANAVLLNMFVLAAYGLDGFAYAAEALVGASVGRRHTEAVKRALWLTGFWSVVMAVLISVVFVLFGKYWIDLLTSIPQVQAAARQFLPWVVILPLAGCWAFWLDGVFVGATLGRDMRNTMLIASSAFFIAWYLLRPLGNHGLWLAMLMFFTLRGILLGSRLRAYLREWTPIR